MKISGNYLEKSDIWDKHSMNEKPEPDLPKFKEQTGKGASVWILIIDPRVSYLWINILICSYN